MEKVLNFLKEVSIFYFATVDGDKPRVRPFGFVMEHNGRLYFGMGNHKQSYKQVRANPNVEICATNSNMEWIRIRGVALFDEDEEAINKAFESSPILKDIYNEESGLTLAIFYIDQGEAEIADMKGNFEKMSF